ncbi:MAG: S4 domain-containing protein, partial [Acidimicrobiia bacterium]
MTVRRRLDAELVRRGLLESPARAADAIAEGRVLVGGSPALVPARMVEASEPIHVTSDAPRFVSRGGEKLAA